MSPFDEGVSCCDVYPFIFPMAGQIRTHPHCLNRIRPMPAESKFGHKKCKDKDKLQVLSKYSIQLPRAFHLGELYSWPQDVYNWVPVVYRVTNGPGINL